jgi:hypothetical protein
MVCFTLERASIAENAIVLLYWGIKQKNSLDVNEDVLAEVPHALRGTNFRVSPPLKAPFDRVAEARPCGGGRRKGPSSLNPRL